MVTDELIRLLLTTAEQIRLLLHILLVGLVGGGWACLVRALPWPEAWKRQKPLACPACMAGWATMLPTWYLASEARWITVGLLWGGALAVAALIFARLNPPALELPE